MYEEIGHAEDGVVHLFAERDLHHRAVFLHNNTVECKRDRHPLVLFDAAIVVRVEIRQTIVLVQRVLLHIKAAGVDVRAEDVHAVLHRLRPDVEEHDCLLHVDGVDLIPRRECFPLRDDIRKVTVARCACATNCLRHALALRLAVREEINVAVRECIDCCAFLHCVFRPDRSLLIVTHNSSFLYLPRLAQNIHELLTRCRAIESLTQLRTAF